MFLSVTFYLTQKFNFKCKSSIVVYRLLNCQLEAHLHPQRTINLGGGETPCSR